MLKVLINKKGKGEELKWDSVPMDEIVAMATTDALFGGAKTLVLTGALYGARADEFVDNLEVFAESPHTFIFEEEKLLKAERTTLEKLGAKIEEGKVVKKEWAFDQHGVAAALAAKDRKKLWLGLMQSFAAGEKAEAVAGLMCWKARQIKNIELSRQLTWLYHDSHRGAGDLELLLERFALKL